MTKEEKQLLFKDLCARLPYGVIVDNPNPAGGAWDEVINIDASAKTVTLLYNGRVVSIDDVKPYLRPMSSMTEEEGKELEDLFCEIDAPCWVDTTYGCVTFAGGNDFIDTEIAEVYTDWLSKKMFDYRELIPMGLALEAPEDMYKTE